jgi:hypothetical protein
MAKSTIMMPFFLTMPMSKITPINAMTERSIFAAISINNAPTPAEGSVDRIAKGRM